MKIEIKDYARVGDKVVAPGEYLVSVHQGAREMNLAGRGIDVRIPAMPRPGKKLNRRTEVSFLPGGGPNWTILVKTPPKGEWVAFLKYDPSAGAASKKSRR